MKKIMLTGLTGYVGGLLATQLLELGHTVQALVRDPKRVTLNHPSLKLFVGDARDADAVKAAMSGCEVGYYLIHGLNESESFEYQECLAAQVFAESANQAGLAKIIYLGGLGDDSANSPHLRSRHLTGKILRLSRVNVTEFRASIVLGNGSASYEMLKALASRLPFFVEPTNLKSLCQPIYFEDLIQYLTQVLNQEGSESRIFEVGGSEQISYAQLLLRVARHSGLERRSISVPEIDPRVLAEAFELICPEYARVGRHLIESLTYETVVKDDSVTRAFPGVMPLGLDESLNRIGIISSDVRNLISKEHAQKIMKMLTQRFPQLKWIYSLRAI